jgi:protocatechuate 3,4-dioxygenase beta subunit
MESDHVTTTFGLTRRRLLRNAGVLALVLSSAGRSAAALAARAAARGVTPEQDQGSDYVALERIRKNIRLGKPGVPLDLRLTVVDGTTGRPLAGAACDVWQCDADGAYSDVGGLTGQTWLRGVQLTDASGTAEFQSIYPGLEPGRAPHVYVKVHVGGKVHGSRYGGGHVAHTGQLFFDDALTTQVLALEPYSANDTARVPNASDPVYTQEGGSKSVLRLTKLGASLAAGVRGTIVLGIAQGSTPTPANVTPGTTGVNGVTTPGQAQVNPTPGPGPGM